METNENDQFRKLIQQAGPEKASLNFTERVMNMVTEHETKEELALASLLRHNIIEEPLPGFTANIMAQLQKKTITVYEPIISKRAWYIIAASVLLLVMISVLFGEDKTTLFGFTSFISKVENSFTFSVPKINFPPLLSMSVICLCFLLFMDYVIKSRKTV